MDKIKIVSELERECFPDSFWDEGAVTAQLSLETTFSNVIFSENEPVGFYLGSSIAGEAELYRIAVRPSLRRRGLASELMKELISSRKGNSDEVIFLEVRSKNIPAIALYEKFGFERIGVRTGYYKDDDALIYKLSL